MIAIESIVFVKGCNGKYKIIPLAYSSELLDCREVNYSFCLVWWGAFNSFK